MKKLLLSLSLSLAVAVAQAQITDANWSAIDTGLGSVNCFANDGGGVYMGGAFSQTMSGFLCENVVRWSTSSSSWQALGSGVGGAAPVSVSGMVYDGMNLYVAGMFTSAGGGACSNLARWDGLNWHDMGGGTNAMISAIAMDPSSGMIYVGGSFTSVGLAGTPCNYIASWDGVNWSTLGTGMNAPVYCLAIGPGGVLYAGGGFTTAGGVSCSSVASWDGSSWSALGAGANGDVFAIAHDGSSNLFVGGYFVDAGGVSCNNIARWDGTNWNALGTGMDNFVYSLAYSSTYGLYAGGEFTSAGGTSCSHIASWNGTTWSALGSGTDSSVSALMAMGDILYVGGAFSSAGGKPNTYGVAQCYLGTISAGFTVTFVEGSNGSITGTLSQSVPSGGDCTEVTAVADTGHQFVNWTGNGGFVTTTTNPLIVTNVTADMTITANFAAIPPAATSLFVGAVLQVASGDVGISGDFTKKPSLRGNYTTALTGAKNTGMTPVSFTAPSPTVTARWSKSLKLYSKSAVTLPKSGWIIANVGTAELGDVTLASVEIKSSQTTPPKVWTAISGLTPIYRNIVDGGISGTETPNTEVIITGQYFGEKAPKIYVEYQNSKGTWKYKLCKINKTETYRYQNAKGEHAKSCTKILEADTPGVTVGDSIVYITYPELPAGAVPSHHLIIDNGSGLNQVPFPH